MKRVIILTSFMLATILSLLIASDVIGTATPHDELLKAGSRISIKQ